MQQFGSHLDRLVPKRARGNPRRLTSHDGNTGGKCSHSEFDPVRKPVRNTDFPVIDPERIGADLRDDGFHSLTDRSRTRDDFHHAIAVHAYSHQIGWPQPAFFHEQCDTSADKLAGGLARGQFLAQERPFDRGQSLVEQTGIIAGIENDLGAECLERAGIRHLLSGNQVSPPYFDPIQTQFVCNSVKQSLANERALEPAGSAIGPARCFVG